METCARSPGKSIAGPGPLTFQDPMPHPVPRRSPRRSCVQPDKAGCVQGPLTYIVNNCIMQRDSQASCPPSSVQMGRRFPSSFCKPPAEQRLGRESGVSPWSPGHHRQPWPLGWALPVRQEEHFIGLNSARSTKAQRSQSSSAFRGGPCWMFSN